MSSWKDWLIEQEEAELARADWRLVHEMTDEDHELLATLAQTDLELKA